MRGIILSGGSGTRLRPLTKITSKQLLPIYNKPMIYYPLNTLLKAGIKEILIIVAPERAGDYLNLLGSGSKFGCKFTYEIQDKPKGLAEAFIIGENFIDEDDVTMILGDNIFYGNLDFVRVAVEGNTGATVFGYHVENPKNFGVVEFDKQRNVVSIEEKPENPKSNYAVVGLYVYNNEVVEISKNLIPSARGELEITDVNKEYLKRNKLSVKLFGRGVAWLDTGTPRALLDASSFIGALEDRQGLKVACLEEVAYMKNFISRDQFKNVINDIPNSSYKEYLIKIYHDKELYDGYQNYEI